MIAIAGANRSYLSALIIPNFEALSNSCMMNRITYSSPSSVILNDKVLEKFKALLDEYNKNAKETEQILKFKLLDKAWSIAGDGTNSENEYKEKCDLRKV